MIEISENCKSRYPGAVIGLLAMRGAENPARHPELERLCKEIESGLREKYGAGDKKALRAHPVLAAYESYYRPFRKTYHVALQLESVIWKGRGIPSVSAVVTAMFMAELSSMLLTAGHDLARVELPLLLDIGNDTETYAGLGGEPRTVKEGDMRISDSAGVISSILGGPDQRTSITPATRDLLFTVYAPAGIGADRMSAHLEDIQRYVKIVSPQAATQTLEIRRAG